MFFPESLALVKQFKRHCRFCIIHEKIWMSNQSYKIIRVLRISVLQRLLILEYITPFSYFDGYWDNLLTGLAHSHCPAYRLLSFSGEQSQSNRVKPKIFEIELESHNLDCSDQTQFIRLIGCSRQERMRGTGEGTEVKY